MHVKVSSGIEYENTQRYPVTLSRWLINSSEHVIYAFLKCVSCKHKHPPAMQTTSSEKCLSNVGIRCFCSVFVSARLRSTVTVRFTSRILKYYCENMLGIYVVCTRRAYKKRTICIVPLFECRCRCQSDHFVGPALLRSHCRHRFSLPVVSHRQLINIFNLEQLPALVSSNNQMYLLLIVFVYFTLHVHYTMCTANVIINFDSIVYVRQRAHWPVHITSSGVLFV